MVRRQDERTGRQALTDDAKRAIMMDVCLDELKRHLALNYFDRYDTYPKAKSAIRDYVELMRHNSDPMEIDEMAKAAEEEYEGKWEEVHAVGNAKGKAKGKTKAKGKDGKGAGEGSGKNSNKTWQEE